MSVTQVAAGASMTRSRRRWALPLALLFGAGLLWSGSVWWTARRYKAEMEQIESEVLAQRYALACRKIEQLLSWKADPNGGLIYLLGSCELARGRNQAAAEAWARVAPGSAFYEKAIRGRMRLLHDSGQLAAAERLVIDAANDPRNDKTSVMALLVPTYREQGRLDESERLIEARWNHLNGRGEGMLEPAVKLVRLHVEISEKPISVENTRAILEQAAKLAPDDDRVWLGRANLAIRTEDYNEAKRWLDACQRQRPDDVPIWRARLDWGIATNRADAVQEALTHLPVTELNPAQRHRWNAWLAVHRKDAVAERQELESLVAVDPSAAPALDRLAALATKDGQPGRAAELQGKRAEVDRLRTRYLKLHERTQPIRDAAELARLAEQLGRRFEARGFLTIAISAANPSGLTSPPAPVETRVCTHEPVVPRYSSTLEELI
jgi:tetratricopeptide (TPR) repeat protein